MIVFAPSEGLTRTATVTFVCWPPACPSAPSCAPSFCGDPDCESSIGPPVGPLPLPLAAGVLGFPLVAAVTLSAARPVGVGARSLFLTGVAAGIVEGRALQLAQFAEKGGRKELFTVTVGSRNSTYNCRETRKSRESNKIKYTGAAEPVIQAYEYRGSLYHMTAHTRSMFDSTARYSRTR